MNGPENQYLVLWKYKVDKATVKRFEFEYGTEGTWFKLFSQSAAYCGSFLHSSEGEPGIYLLIDTWTDRASYEQFKIQHAAIYDKLSKEFESLYETEELLGTYCRLKAQPPGVYPLNL